MSTETSLSERNSVDRSADDNTLTDYTLVASYHEKESDRQPHELFVPLSQRDKGFKSAIFAWWKKLFS